MASTPTKRSFTMTTLPFVTNTSIFAIMTGWLSVHAPFVNDRFWGRVKNNAELDSILFASTHGDDDEQHDAHRALIVELWDVVAGCLSSAMVEELDCHTRTAITHMEVAQASNLEPWEEQEVWAHWERIDAQQAEQDRLNMYYNEY